MKNPPNNRERGLIKGALRRVFSRSELRQLVIKKALIKHTDTNRPRVTKWAWCADCGIIEASYKMQVDHQSPVIRMTETLEDLTWDALVDRLWCSEDNLRVVCVDCHKEKTKAENKERRLLKKGNKK